MIKFRKFIPNLDPAKNIVENQMRIPAKLNSLTLFVKYPLTSQFYACQKLKIRPKVREQVSPLLATGLRHV
jgi:hypothetical protein